MARHKQFFWACFFSAACIFTSQSFAASGEETYRKLILGRHYKQAVALLTKSAKSGNPLSQYRLAVMLRSGLGIKRDDAQARDWLRKSAQKGNADAAKLMKSLGTIVTSQAMPVPVSAPLRSARVASFAHLKPRREGDMNWLSTASARKFHSLEVGGAAAKDINGRDATGQTPLITAARAGNMKLVEQLIAMGADVNLTDVRGMSAYLWSIETGNIALAKILVAAAANVDQKSATGDSVDLIAARNCNLQTLEEVSGHFRQSRSNYSGQTAAHMLAKNCRELAVPKQFFSDEDMTAIDNAGRTPLWFAIASDNEKMAAALIERDAGLTTADNDGNTPLHIAASSGNAIAVSALLQKQASPEALDKNLNTPLMLAAANGRTESVKLLLPLAADINQKNIDGETVLTLAVKSGSADIVSIVVMAGGATTSRTISRDTPEKIVERLGNKKLEAALQ